jgi:hypothetical protein
LGFFAIFACFAPLRETVRSGAVVVQFSKLQTVAPVAIFFARRGDFAHGGTGILPVRTAKMAVPRLGCGSAALYHCPSFDVDDPP